MFSTTLRIPDDLAAYLQEAAKDASMSVNAWLAQLLERERAEARRRRLAQDWAVYAADLPAQEVDYALPAQRELVAEPLSPPYGSGGGSPKSPRPSRRRPKA
jgi:hypothetical protein